MKKSNVQLRGDRNNYHPAVNVKVYKSLDDGVQEFHKSEPTAEKRFTEEWIRANVSDACLQDIWNDSCQQYFEQAEEQAKDIFGSHVVCYSEGRSNGWITVYNLTKTEAWDAVMLAKWAKFEKVCKMLASDVPYGCVWDIYYNIFKTKSKEREQEIQDDQLKEE